MTDIDRIIFKAVIKCPWVWAYLAVMGLLWAWMFFSVVDTFIIKTF